MGSREKRAGASRSAIKKAIATACASAALALVGSCSSSNSAARTFAGGDSAPAPKLSLSAINNGFSAMSALKPLAARGRGSIAVILPDDATASHFGAFDAPYFRESFKKTGLKESQYSVQMPLGSDQFSAAQKAIRRGASVLIVDTRYSGAGVRIESYAKAHGVAVIDYDWLTLGGSRNYYVAFDGLKIGVLLGQGLVTCASEWGVKHPQVIVMSGDPIDYNSAMYTEGYDAVLAGQFASGWQVVSNPPGTWNGNIALSEFQQEYAAHKNINAALIPNDEDGAPIIQYLQSQGVKAKTFPTTGLDATLTGLRNILTGYQCGTVYKPIWLEAQAAAALAMYVRAGVTPPGSLLNWSITDPQTNTSVPAVLLTPEWVTTENIKSTVLADDFVAISKLCAGPIGAACAENGISG
jgi:D-xylose transport system substrate-binding protein